MQFSTLIRYGLRVVLYLGMVGGIRSSHDISRAVDIPRDYVIQIAQLLRQGAVIKAYAGKNGGYELAKDPASITEYDVISALEGGDPVPYGKKAGEVVADDTAELPGIMKALYMAASLHDDFLKEITIAKIMEDGGLPAVLDAPSEEPSEE